MPTADEIIRRLNLVPHPEGGFYRETYRSGETFPPEKLPGRYTGARVFSTAIYYLLTPDTFSEIHRLQSDEVFHFYFGDPVIQLHLLPDGSHRVFHLGADLQAGEIPQILVPRGVWQGSILKEEGEFALLGATVAPGFEFEDYESGRREDLIRQYPSQESLIRQLTRG